VGGFFLRDGAMELWSPARAYFINIEGKIVIASAAMDHCSTMPSRVQ
jgi:hypothetical protein